MRNFETLLLIAWLSLLGSAALAYADPAEIAIATDLSCIGDYSAPLPKSFQYKVSPAPAAGTSEDDPRTIVAKVEKAMRLGVRIIVYSATEEAAIGTACATMAKDGVRAIYYDPKWLERYSKGNRWVKFGILAHEVGHHANSHTLGTPKNAWEREYEADVFMGGAIRALNGRLDQALSAVAGVDPPEGDETHPPRAIREAAVRMGWEGQSDTIKPPVEDSIWSSPATYCNNLVNLILRPATSYSPTAYLGDPKLTPVRTGPIPVTIFNPAYAPKNQCAVTSSAGHLLGSCVFIGDDEAYRHALSDMKTCLMSHQWQVEGTAIAGPGASDPSDITVFQRRFDYGRMEPPQGIIDDSLYSDDELHRSHPELLQQVTLRRLPNDFLLEWQIRQ